MSQIVVFGATGYAGGNIARELASRGHRIVAVSRSIEAEQAPDNGEARAGSIFDGAFVREVTEGADVVVVALRFNNGDEPNLVEAFPTLLDVAAERGARVGIVGGAGSLNVAEDGPKLIDTPDFPDAFKGEAGAAGEALEHLRAYDGAADWFYVSPAAGFGSYNPGERTGSYRTGGDVLLTDAEGNSNISGADFAIAFADEIEQPKHHRTRFGVAY
ncbi:NAD-dependent epimerase [Pseudoclavibacter endophyticus]|uniref:NAD(P)H-binding protein n=1 Tax=Pseudoclavibacter endophyticus TaxID=1778590 RepID=A0A6H9WN19_9MICO|nr:NAD(P)H-binding protein [Pseudoclavibacter endophyticus]KAB1650276.1 NAD(P)H-binding protein [Pseudoclavibacter endophyticus]GGA55580.1 NAD-dependent epimerase [Pseudoclavibacter endophyticus]